MKAATGGTVTITDKAAEKVVAFQQSMQGAADKQLRIAIRAGGCSGFSYDFVFDTKRDGDFEVAAKGTTVLVDSMSMNMLNGSTIDYVETVQGAGFVVDNPNASGGCGCGSSFSA
ncbi:MAG: iron-sulfur cluster insertion protein ErpA [Deltaproteobacteria bacterium]|nr:iron-sulfur cluster insertion protein ErpA [Deltaproteobacteria bacterium]